MDRYIFFALYHNNEKLLKLLMKDKRYTRNMMYGKYINKKLIILLINDNECLIRKII